MSEWWLATITLTMWGVLLGLYPHRPLLIGGLVALLPAGLAVALMGGAAEALVGTLCGLMAPGAVVMARELWAIWR
jgi:hypothetical protein